MNPNGIWEFHGKDQKKMLIIRNQCPSMLGVLLRVDCNHKRFNFAVVDVDPKAGSFQKFPCVKLRTPMAFFNQAISFSFSIECRRQYFTSVLQMLQNICYLIWWMLCSGLFFHVPRLGFWKSQTVVLCLAYLGSASQSWLPYAIWSIIFAWLVYSVRHYHSLI